MKNLLALAAAVEVTTGLVLLVHPPVVVWLLFGAEITGVGIVISRIAGISLVALGLACWPGGVVERALSGMLTYSSLVTLYLVYLGVGGEWVGTLLWTAVVIHAVITVLLARVWFRGRNTPATKALN